MKKIIILFLLVIIFISACQNVEEPVIEVECNNDNDCATGGCSGQICGEKGEVEDITTTCEFREEYACLKETSCSCMNNKCEWEENDTYLNCLANI